MRFVVDTNVAVVANGRVSAGERQHSPSCRLATVQFLNLVVNQGRVVVDAAGEVRAEYRHKLRPSGQPGVGDLFYREILNSHPNRVESISLEKLENGEFADCPASLVQAGFDPSDRKFVALAKRADCPVANAVDSDWIDHATLLEAEGIEVNNLCGCNPHQWFED